MKWCRGNESELGLEANRVVFANPVVVQHIVRSMWIFVSAPRGTGRDMILESIRELQSVVQDQAVLIIELQRQVERDLRRIWRQ